ncbi:MAG: hypothetical protein R6V77_06190 [Candidatus Cloacimonadaceae bacterium]
MKFHWIIWIPRILMMLLIAFVTLFSLDVFEMDTNIWNKLLGFLIHNIPSILLLLVLLFTWKKPLFAGIFYIVLAIALSVFWKTYEQLTTFLVFTVPMLVTGGLFIISQYQKPAR